MVEMKIYELRKAKGWTTRQLSKAAQISKSQISRIERNESFPTIGALCDIAHALEVPVTSTFRYRY